jgi:3,4-dihydroxy 2-butanone 4-phosphate synthase/GTP cyclohydrolase II
MCLLTNNPKKIVGLEGYDLEVIKRLPIEIKPVSENLSYLKCKKDKMGHLLDLPENTEL